MYGYVGEDGMRTALLFCVLSLAAVSDLRTRIIPNWMPIVVTCLCLIPPGNVHLTGMLAVLPLLVAGITVGGIGGGDIKLAAACGLVLGFERTFIALIMALFFLIVFHTARVYIGKWTDAGKQSEAYPFVPFMLISMVINSY